MPTVLDVIADQAVRSVFQPIVDLDYRLASSATRRSRAGPLGSDLETPAELFGSARRLGALAALDDACRIAAFRGALRCGLLAPLTLFVNVEPEVLDTAPLDDLLAIAATAPARAAGRLRDHGALARRTSGRAAAHRRAHPPARLADRARRRRRRSRVARVHAAAASRGGQARPAVRAGACPAPRPPPSCTRSAPTPSSPARSCWPRASRTSGTWRWPAASARGSARAGCSAGRRRRCPPCRPASCRCRGSASSLAGDASPFGVPPRLGAAAHRDEGAC